MECPPPPILSWVNVNAEEKSSVQSCPSGFYIYRPVKEADFSLAYERVLIYVTFLALNQCHFPLLFSLELLTNCSAMGCQHHCVPTVNGPACYCNSSFQLADDGKSCKGRWQEDTEGRPMRCLWGKSQLDCWLCGYSILFPLPPVCILDLDFHTIGCVSKNRYFLGGFILKFLITHQLYRC